MLTVWIMCDCVKEKINLAQVQLEPQALSQWATIDIQASWQRYWLVWTMTHNCFGKKLEAVLLTVF
jgi:hypothetical protein